MKNSPQHTHHQALALRRPVLVEGRKPGLLAALFICMAFASPTVAAKTVMEPVVTQGARGLDELGIASKHDAHSVVAVRSGPQLARRRPAEFSVMVVNLADGPVPFGLDAISVRQDGKSLEVLDEQELAEQLERRKSRRQMFGALVTAVGVVADVRASEVTGMAGAFFTTEALSLMEQWSEQSDQVIDQALTEYSQSALSGTTVLPKEKHGGSFMVEGIKPSGGPVDIEVRVGDQSHSLRFRPARR